MVFIDPFPSIWYSCKKSWYYLHSSHHPNLWINLQFYGNSNYRDNSSPWVIKRVPSDMRTVRRRFLIPGEAPALLTSIIRPQHDLDHSQVLTFEWTEHSDPSAGSPLPTGSSTHCAGVGQDRNLALSSILFHFITLSSSRVLQTLRRPFKTFADASLINQISLSWILCCAPSSSWAVGTKSWAELSPPPPSRCLPLKKF